MMINACSICGSPAADPAPTTAAGTKRARNSRKKTPLKDKHKTGKSERLSASNAESFCSAFGLPTDKFVPVLTNRKKSFCQGCSGQILAIDSIVKQIEELKMQLEWCRKAIEDNIRVRHLSRTQETETLTESDYEIVDLMFLHLPHLVTIKTEIVDTDPPPHEDASSRVELYAETGAGNLPSTTPTSALDEDYDDNFEDFDSSKPASGLKKWNSRRRASVKASTKLKVKQVDRKIGDMESSLSEDTEDEHENDSDDYVPEVRPTGPTKRARTSRRAKRSEKTDPDAGLPNEDVETSKRAGYQAGGGIRLTPKVITDRKKILNYMESNPHVTKRQMQTHFRNNAVARSFRHLWHKEKWIKEIAEYEKSIADAAAGQCSRCLAGFQKIGALRYHFIDIHPPRSDFVCEICEQVLDSQDSLTAHSLLHVPTDKNEYSCLQCGTLLPDLQSLRLHSWWHEFRAFKCGKTACDKFFSSSSGFVAHNCRKRPKNIICELCGKSFRLPKALARHKISHSDEKPFSCHVCEDKRFKTDFSRVMHLRKIHGYHGPGAKYPPEVPLPPAQAECGVSVSFGGVSSLLN